MYFLNGDRLYIKPDRCRATFEEQLSSCFAKLDKVGKRIYKLNFFADVSTGEQYKQLQNRIKKMADDQFNDSLVFALIAQPPLDCSIFAEIFYCDETLWQHRIIKGESGAAVLFSREGTDVFIGHVQSDSYTDCRKNAETVFGLLREILKNAGLGMNAVIRQWNYIEKILALDGASQRYQEFNDVRSAYYKDYFNDKGYPAATGIGMNCGGVIIEFVAMVSKEALSLPLKNPEQSEAYDYSNNVLVGSNHKTTPKFERARYLELFGKKQLLVSGTASIRGEKTMGAGNPEEQTHVTIQNMQRLYSADVLKSFTGLVLQPVYGHARVYLKNRKDFSIVKQTFRSYYGNLPVVYLMADICRNDLLVEIEGKVILE